MLIAYVDETGDTGDPTKKGASSCFGLGCILIDSEVWTEGFDRFLAFRRKLRDDFGLPVRAEVKANYLIRGSGPLRGLNLSPAQRGLIYRYHLNSLGPINARAFAVVVQKDSAGVTGPACLDMAWTTLLQRLERTTSAEKTDVMVVHDHGENDAVRKIIRRARRRLSAGSAFGTGGFQTPLRRLVDDPVPRHSHESYFIQLADLVAYAGWRTHMPAGAGAGRVVGKKMWNALGEANHSAVNGFARRGEPGVVLRY